MKQFSTRNNKYDYLLIALIALLAAGKMGGGFQPVRVFILLLAPIYLSRNLWVFKKYKMLFQFCLLWLSYSALTLLMAYDLTYSVLKWLYTLCHILGMFLLLYFFDKSNNKIRTLSTGWILMFLITLPVALWELNTNRHLSYALEDQEFMQGLDMYGSYIQRRTASVTFGNLNSYNTVLCMVVPFVISGMMSKSLNKRLSIMLYVVATFLIYVLIMNSSRGAFLVLSLGLLFMLYQLLKRSIILSVFISFFFLAVMTFMYLSGYFDSILGRMAMSGMEDEERMNMIINSFDALLNNGFLGIGLGNFGYVMSQVYHTTIQAPHNLFIELLSENGLVVFIWFCCILWWIFKTAWRAPYSMSKYVGMLGIILLPFIGVIDAGYFSAATTFLYLGSLIAASNFCKNEYSRLF